MTAVHKKTFLKEYSPPDFTIEKVFIDFALYDAYTLVDTTLHIKKCTEEDSPLILNGVMLELMELKLDGQVLAPEAYTLTPEALMISNPPKAFELKCQTKIYPQKNTQLTGLYQSGQQYCTQCEAEGFRHITYFLDRPDVMATYKTRISADKKKFPILLSNGNLIGTGDESNGRHWVLWEDPFKKPSYLFAMVAGHFDVLEDNFKTQSGRDIKLCIYVEPGDLQKSQHAMQALKKAMRWDEVKYQREYDLDLYLIVSIRDFNAGAMENKGLNIFNAQYILADPSTATDDDYLSIESVIAHEYFHNWTGNRITCRDWFQLSLKEGLTIFRDQSFTEDTFSKAVARIRSVTALRMRQFPEDASPLAHPVQPNAYIDISNFYSSTVYNKGAEVIRMIKTLIGEQAFFEGMQWYFAHYDGMAITIDDFIHAFSITSGYDFTQFKLWYTQAGTPHVSVWDEYDAQKNRYTLHFKQETPKTGHDGPKKPQVIPIKTALFDDKGAELPIEKSLIVLTKAKEQFVFENIKTKPTPSLLRGFSAPVKLDYPYTLEQITTLFQYDDDRFNRFEITQIYAHKILKSLTEEYLDQKHFTEPKAFIETFNRLITSTVKASGEDKYFIAELLVLPSEKLIAEKMTEVHPEAIHEAREFLVMSLSTHGEPHLVEVYEATNIETPSDSIDFSMKAMANRRLKNLALAYLSAQKKETFTALAWKQFKTANLHNMTDLLGAFRCLINASIEAKEEAVALYYDEWNMVPEVMDKWFGQQALSKLSDTLEKVEALTHHPKFSFKNPNQVYALIGGYTQQNPALFHDDDGKSYRFLGEVVRTLNSSNPILAAAMVKPLLDWRRYTLDRQKHMYQELELVMAQKNISKTLYEVVKASLK